MKYTIKKGKGKKLRKTHKGIKIKRNLRIRIKKLPPFKKILKPTILPFIHPKKDKSNMKAISSNPDGLEKVLKASVPDNLTLIQTMSSLLIMYYRPDTKDKIEKKYQELLEKLIEIY